MQAYTKIYFGENQLSPSLISLSLLPTSHPSSFHPHRFGPPFRLTGTSSCSWVAHWVSGLLRTTSRPIQTRFRSGSASLNLTLQCRSNSLAHNAKGTWSRSFILALPPLVNIWFQILFHSSSEVLFTFPSRYSFTIGCQIVFSFTPWSGLIPTEFHVFHSTWDLTLQSQFFHIQDCHLLWRAFPLSSVKIKT